MAIDLARLKALHAASTNPPPSGYSAHYLNALINAAQELISRAEDADCLQSSLDAALAELNDLKQSIADLSHPNCKMLLAELDALKAEVADWRDTQRAVMSEKCQTDEVHCTCVPMLKKKIAELEAERDRLRKALQEIIEFCDKFKIFRRVIEIARAALEKEQSNA